MFKSFKVECPHCGGNKLFVIEATIATSGETLDGKRFDWKTETLDMRAELHEDGFEFDLPDGVKDGSTEDEVVECASCKKTFSLDKVTL